MSEPRSRPLNNTIRVTSTGICVFRYHFEYFKCVTIALITYSIVMLAYTLQLIKLSEDMPKDVSQMVTIQD